MWVKVKIKLNRENFKDYASYSLELSRNSTLLDMLVKIKEELDQSLAFRSMCRAGICGTCAIKVNGRPVLACSTKVFVFGEEITVEPIDNVSVIKDLVVDHESLYNKLKLWKVWYNAGEKNTKVSASALKRIERSHECILCGICDSVCPVLTTSSHFGGPTLLTRYYKLLFDPRNTQDRAQSLKNLNPQLCTHCMNCSFACPKKLMPEALIKEEEKLLQEKGIIKKEEGNFGFLEF
ncbi:succinate dehydrogenase/fumarate reductase iron-sulfur subunit [Hydrogenobacter hydrogenophilus]|uniref:Fumarate reductase iron-sulfur subunit n=1 Tax=Hydrogenobacter hydrogenophilus TaxID=35835 RepID=A0A285NZP0_9AQUI|nr:2Fe-2S iron-sulfur cluster-binding protein [Hydrogenobacter hydrogenophilus]SNZ14403.1 succinate dehydrogenase / fumarate reductase iron-sulfur subunit/fumarate reductase iron-sulfur subunit [Hydrogenobacter hydrogenophilus]